MKATWYLLYLCLFFFATATFAQGENNHWHFGHGYHIDFNVSPPVYAPNSNIATYEASTAVSDAQGNLLFYTMGCRIWDRNGNEMPNATGLLGNGPVNPVTGFGMGSSVDGVQVLPHPGNRNQYYIFSGDDRSVPTSTMYYHLVDMSLNNGLGDVVPTQKNVIVLSEGCTEWTASAMGSCNTFWFIATTDSGTYHAYKIDEQGIHLNPVISSPALTPLPDIMCTRITPDGIAYSLTYQGLIRSLFNSTTGTFSNYELIPGIGGLSFELSPDHQKLYCGNQLKQWDLSLYPDIPAISASAVTLDPNSQSAYTSPRLGPDGKIYILRALIVPGNFSFYIDRIDQPDALGLAAAYVPQVFTLPPSELCNSLGARFIALPPLDTIVNPERLDTLLCKDGPVTLMSPHTHMRYSWNNGATSREIIADQEGIYHVYSYDSDCKVYIDSFKVVYAHMDLDLGTDTVLCAGDSYTLDATQPNATAYRWNDGSTGPQKTINVSGTYAVTVSRDHCFVSDTIMVAVKAPEVTIAPNDTFICEREKIELSASSNFESRFSWSTGEPGNHITIDREGIYVVTATNVCGIQTDSVRIAQLNCDCQPTIPNAFSPNGDGKNDVFLPLLQPTCVTRSYELLIYNRYGQVVFSTNQPSVGWDGTYVNGRTAELGVYYYILKLESSYSNRPPVMAKGEVTLVR